MACVRAAPKSLISAVFLQTVRYNPRGPYGAGGRCPFRVHAAQCRALFGSFSPTNGPTNFEGGLEERAGTQSYEYWNGMVSMGCVCNWSSFGTRWVPLRNLGSGNGAVLSSSSLLLSALHKVPVPASLELVGLSTLCTVSLPSMGKHKGPAGGTTHPSKFVFSKTTFPCQHRTAHPVCPLLVAHNSVGGPSSGILFFGRGG